MRRDCGPGGRAGRPSSRLGRLAAPALVLVAMVAVAAGAAAAPVRLPATTAVSRAPRHADRGARAWLPVGGPSRWRAFLTFRVAGFTGRPRRVTLVLHARGARRPRLAVHRARRRIGHVVAVARPRRCRRARRTRCVLTADLTKVVSAPGTALHLALTGRRRGTGIAGRRAGRRRAPALVVVPRRGPLPVATTGPGPVAAPGPPAPIAPVRPPVAGIWTSPAELASRPTSGPAWQALKSAADAPLGVAGIADQDSDDDVDTLAVALVYARTGIAAYRAKAAGAIAAAIGTEAGGRALALGRNLASYVIAADLVGLARYDPPLDARFRAWLRAVRTESLAGLTLIATHETRPNNWGTMAGASRVAADAYLGDAADLGRAAAVFRGWLGDRRAYAGFSFGDVSWQADPSAPVAVDPAGAVRQGLSIDGALPEEMRRGCVFTVPPCHTAYAWEAMQGAVVQAEILSRRGFDAFAWQSGAILRAARFLQRLDALYGGWWAAGDDRWQPWIIDRAYGVRLPAATPSGVGKVMAWADWVFG
jgi:hypothetical protein